MLSAKSWRYIAAAIAVSSLLLSMVACGETEESRRKREALAYVKKALYIAEEAHKEARTISRICRALARGEIDPAAAATILNQSKRRLCDLASVEWGLPSWITGETRNLLLQGEHLFRTSLVKFSQAVDYLLKGDYYSALYLLSEAQRLISAAIDSFDRGTNLLELELELGIKGGIST